MTEKTETAINIGYSCKLLTDELEDLIIVDGNDEQTVKTQLEEAWKEMEKNLDGSSLLTNKPDKQHNEGNNLMLNIKNFIFKNKDNQSSTKKSSAMPKQVSFVDSSQYALVINGDSLVSLFHATVIKFVICLF